MLERFTGRARRAVVLATEEARSRGHESVGPEHLLMGIMRDSEGMAVKVIERLQVPPETLRAEVDRLIQRSAALVHGYRTGLLSRTEGRASGSP
jgi:ATP-dependent Clp protease ATP-binding subunit ClpC